MALIARSRRKASDVHVVLQDDANVRVEQSWACPRLACESAVSCILEKFTNVHPDTAHGLDCYMTARSSMY